MAEYEPLVQHATLCGVCGEYDVTIDDPPRHTLIDTHLIAVTQGQDINPDHPTFIGFIGGRLCIGVSNLDAMYLISGVEHDGRSLVCHLAEVIRHTMQPSHYPR